DVNIDRADRLGLILPTSLCASQVARGIARQLNATAEKASGGVTRFVALPHTEGCGVSGGISEQLYLRTMAGYLAHPLVARALVLEHGCEKTHNDAMRDFIAQRGIDPQRFGWASIQLDGGFEKVTGKIASFFQLKAELSHPPQPLTIALTASEAVPDLIAEAFAQAAAAIVESGGSVVVPQNCAALLEAPAFKDMFTGGTGASVAYGEAVRVPGFHIMEAPTEHWIETLTGLGGTGAEIIVAYVQQALQGHPLVPTIQLGPEGAPDIDAAATGEGLADRMLELVRGVARGGYVPRNLILDNTDFQITRGLLGVSL
ncbi:MAG: UxaA family hydrolase, partial [Verrucomicrobia subdivision 3 bacterium]|nr:UxaA family hydrolase [Limisphaerales bacterium]